MIEKALIRIDAVSDKLLSNLENRDVALWVRRLPKDPPDQDALLAFLGLPWRLVLLETHDPDMLNALEAAATFSDPMTRKRGFIQIIDSDPSRIELPQRCLPIYLLRGRQVDEAPSDFRSQLRRVTMLDALRRSEARELLVVSGGETPVPPELTDLWSSDFRPFLTFASTAPDAEEALQEWVDGIGGVALVSLLRLPVGQLVDDIRHRYATTYPKAQRVIRVRDLDQAFHRIDITEADEPERPILDSYSLLEERDLTPLTPEELSEEDLEGFFRDPATSWRPYAAGLPWVRDSEAAQTLSKFLRKLDIAGSEENCIAYIASESGAGGTTLARVLAWECARLGYPVLFAKPFPFVPEALPIVNFLKRVHSKFETESRSSIEPTVGTDAAQPQNRKDEPTSRRYETPWLIVFDSLHWQYRDSELVSFRNEMQKSGRPVCVLIVTSTILGLSFYNTSIFKKVAELTHVISQEEARLLGRHLNRFLRVYGKQRHESQWVRFYRDHTVRYLEGTVAFWVTLSFWIQGQYDLTESIQEWMYRSFKRNTDDSAMRSALLEIAALSSERLPLPEALLPSSAGEWPLSHLLEDSRADLAALGLVRISSQGEKYWTLIHDILGRFLINALFYDFPLRKELGFAEAKDAEHLRFLLLRRIAQKPALGDRAYRSIGEDFATSILKIDPDRGHGSFALLWREVLDTLDGMPLSLRGGSRAFRHHTAISRRRIAKLDERLYGVTIDERVALLSRAIEDIEYALHSIDYTPGSESNLNLWNSLANAYLDLANNESARGAPSDRVRELQRLANEATRKAYEENPTNSFVIETCVKNLLQIEGAPPAQVVEQCIEALGLIASALSANEVDYRVPQLGALADKALDILFHQTPPMAQEMEPARAVDVLVKAWTVLAEGNGISSRMGLSDVPEANRRRALDVLLHPAGRGNMQIIRLTFDLLCVSEPYAFKRQLELVEQLQATDYRMTPQTRLEYAILLFQNGRAVEGGEVFRSLRQLWREGEQFVRVPQRLRWLRTEDGRTLQTVQAVVGSDYGTRAMARVQKFNNTPVPLRPEEFGLRDLRPGMRLACRVSFGFNGPFLRPPTAGRGKAD
ncbi:MAG: hypothetical protein OXE53_10705 [Deltaproteobacteria bacterium]|nr:hypothetical protein [Deltaproteobacteria bacterium]